MMKNQGQTAIQPMQTIDLRNRLAACIACILALGMLFVAAPMQAATNLFWTATDGDFGTAANWSPALVPGAGDSANFTTNASYTVTFASSFTQYGQRRLLWPDSGRDTGHGDIYVGCH